jgi:hypothetical protein
MDKIMQSLATLRGANWGLSVHVQVSLERNDFREYCYRRMPDAQPEFWLTVGSQVFISDTIPGLFAFARKLAIDLSNATKDQPAGFAHLYCCWIQGDDASTVIAPGDDASLSSITTLALWRMKTAPAESLAPIVAGEQLTFHAHEMTSLGDCRFRHQLFRFDLSLRDFAVVRRVIAELVDEG